MKLEKYVKGHTGHVEGIELNFVDKSKPMAVFDQCCLKNNEFWREVSIKSEGKKQKKRKSVVGKSLLSLSRQEMLRGQLTGSGKRCQRHF